MALQDTPLKTIVQRQKTPKEIKASFIAAKKIENALINIANNSEVESNAAHSNTT